jgi:hypothetical protein
MSERQKLPRVRGRLVVSLLLVAAAGGAYVTARVGVGGASAPRAATPLREGALPPALRDAIVRAARADGVDPGTVVEAAVTGTGDATMAALVGAGADGAVRVSFFHGFGMTQFQPPGRLFRRGADMAFSEGYSGPQHEPVRVGIVGAVRPSVERITIDLADGRALEAPLVASRGLQFFAYAGGTPDAFPVSVHAYDRSGSLVQTHEIPRP